VVGLTELGIYEALAVRTLAKSLDGIIRDLADVKLRANAPRMWASVRDQAEFTLSRYIDNCCGLRNGAEGGAVLNRRWKRGLSSGTTEIAI